MRDAAAAHLRHIASEKGDEALKPRDFAIAAYVEFLEDKSKRLRRASLIALGFLNAKEAMSQLQYICMAAPEPEIREAAKNVLVSERCLFFRKFQNLRYDLRRFFTFT